MLQSPGEQLSNEVLGFGASDRPGECRHLRGHFVVGWQGDVVDECLDLADGADVEPGYPVGEGVDEAVEVGVGTDRLT
ncbi:hypothetical protein JCM12141A_55310 [Mycolicibacterium hodleri]